MHSCRGNFLTYRCPRRNLMSGSDGGSRKGHRSLYYWEAMKAGKEVIGNTSETEYLARTPDRKLGETGCNSAALCKAGVFQMKSQEIFQGSKYTDLCNPFSLRKVETSQLQLPKKCQIQPPPRIYVNMYLWPTLKQYVFKKAWSSYTMTILLLFLPFWAFPPFTHLGICGPASPTILSNELQHEFAGRPKFDQVWKHRWCWSRSLNWTCLCATFSLLVQVWTDMGL